MIGKSTIPTIFLFNTLGDLIKFTYYESIDLHSQRESNYKSSTVGFFQTSYIKLLVQRVVIDGIHAKPIATLADSPSRRRTVIDPYSSFIKLNNIHLFISQ